MLFCMSFESVLKTCLLCSHRSHRRVPHRPGEDSHAEPALHRLLRGRADVQEQLRLCEESTPLRGLLWILQRWLHFHRIFTATACACCAKRPTWWKSIRELITGAWFSNWYQNPLPSVFSSSQGFSLSLYLGEFPERKWPAVFMYRLICLSQSADNRAEGFWYTRLSPLGSATREGSQDCHLQLPPVLQCLISPSAPFSCSWQEADRIRGRHARLFSGRIPAAVTQQLLQKFIWFDEGRAMKQYGGYRHCSTQTPLLILSMATQLSLFPTNSWINGSYIQEQSFFGLLSSFNRSFVSQCITCISHHL